jgi:hypothetical protein
VEQRLTDANGWLQKRYAVNSVVTELRAQKSEVTELYGVAPNYPVQQKDKDSNVQML